MTDEDDLLDYIPGSADVVVVAVMLVASAVLWATNHRNDAAMVRNVVRSHVADLARSAWYRIGERILG